jgi:DNA-binding transcriptional ArsR family regulator
MSIDIDDTVTEYTDALKTEDRVRTLTGFYEGEDVDAIEDDVGVASETVEEYLETYDELGFLEQDDGDVTDLGAYVADMTDTYGHEEVAALFGAVRDELGLDILERVDSDDGLSMTDVADDHGVAPGTASSRYGSLEDAGFAQSSRQRRWKTYDLTEQGEDAIEDLEELAEQVEAHGSVGSLDRIAAQVGTVTETQQDDAGDRVVEEDEEYDHEQETFGYEGWDEGQ